MDQKITITKKIATFIRQKRLVLGMSQREFAIHVFGDQRKKDWIGKIERGRPISLLTVEKIFEKVNADISIIEY